MVQQTFPVSTRHPRVVISNVEGNLNVQPWERQEISVEAQGELRVLNQEADTIMISDCSGDLVLWVPSLTKRIFGITTDITATNVRRSATIVKAGNVALKEVGGSAVLQDIHGNVEVSDVHEGAELTSIGGNLRAAHMPRLRVQNVGGNAILLDTRETEIHAVGGNLAVTHAEVVNCRAVGGDLDVEHIEARLECTSVGGNCEARRCTNAVVKVHTVGGNLTCDGAAQALSSMVGGNLHLQSDFPAGTQSHCHVGGNAYVTLPANANLEVKATVGGNASGPGATYTRGGGFVHLLYGEGTAKLGLTVGGNLYLAGSEPRKSSSQLSWDDFGASMSEFGRGMAEFGREMGRLGSDISHDVLRRFMEV